MVRIEQKLCEECAISEPRKKMKEDRRGGRLVKGVVGEAMAQRRRADGERDAEIDRSPVQTTC